MCVCVYVCMVSFKVSSIRQVYSYKKGANAWEYVKIRKGKAKQMNYPTISETHEQ